MKSNKGITLLILIIMVIIISILAGVIINSGMGAYREAKLTQFVARMNMIQSRVNVAYTEIKNEYKNVEDYGISADRANGSVKNKIKKIIPDGNLSDYRYLSKANLRQDLELQNLSEEIIVNFDTREIYNLEGIEYEGVMFYNQYHLPNGQYNIDFKNNVNDAPEFNLSKRNYGLYSYVDVENIVYKGNVNGGKIYYGKITEENNGELIVDYWKESEKEIYIDITGEYAVKVVDKVGNETVEKINIVLANAPELTDDMTAVIYDENKKQWKKVSQADEGKWYDYAENKWANIMMNDVMETDSNGYITSYGSMFVWIPRYAYNIKNGFHTGTAGDIEVKFLKGTTSLTTDESNITYSDTSGNDKWLIHPAFKDGTKNGYANGEWNQEIEGIWMAKFETSMETNGTHTETNSASTGNVLTNDKIKAVSKPGVSSWRYINIGNAYKNGLNYNKNANSHLIKNSEWGAVAYLTQSKYGRNKQEVTINNSFLYTTGNAGSTVDAAASGTTNAYDTSRGILASTTGNIYGVYDMSGGAWEYTASVIQTGNESMIGSGGDIANIKSSSKYITTYPVGGSTQEQTDISRSYAAWNNIYGDAIWETSNMLVDYIMWNGDNADEDSESNEPFMKRGGSSDLGSLAGIFAINDDDGEEYYQEDCTSRLVLIVKEEPLPEVDENGLAKEDTTITTDDPNVQIVIPKGFAPVILESDRTDSLPGEDGAVKEIMPVEDWNSITAEQINKGIVVVDNPITYTDGVPDFNEYVWIPIADSSKFKRVSWDGEILAEESTTDDAYWEETSSAEYTDMVDSVSINRGFYISRYEASQKNSATAQSKRGQNPWTGVTQTTVITASSNMKTSINSHLIYGIEWDSVLQWLLDSEAKIGPDTSGGDLKTITIYDIQDNSSCWGNYRDSVGDAATNSRGSAKPGGTNEYWKVNNIYDIAGNASERIQENYSTDLKGARGGYYNIIGDNSAGHRSRYAASFRNNDYLRI